MPRRLAPAVLGHQAQPSPHRRQPRPPLLPPPPVPMRRPTIGWLLWQEHHGLVPAPVLPPLAPPPAPRLHLHLESVSRVDPGTQAAGIRSGTATRPCLNPSCYRLHVSITNPLLALSRLQLLPPPHQTAYPCLSCRRLLRASGSPLHHTACTMALARRIHAARVRACSARAVRGGAAEQRSSAPAAGSREGGNACG